MSVRAYKRRGRSSVYGTVPLDDDVLVDNWDKDVYPYRNLGGASGIHPSTPSGS